MKSKSTTYLFHYDFEFILPCFYITPALAVAPDLSLSQGVADGGTTPLGMEVRQPASLMSIQGALVFSLIFSISSGFPGSSGGKESACNAGDPGLIPGSGVPVKKA